MIKSGIICVLLLLVLTGCDRLGAYEYYLENKSDSTLVVNYKWLDKLESKKVLPKTRVIIDSMETNNNLSDLRGRFLKRYFDTIYVLSNGSVIGKDINKRENWSYFPDEDKYSNIYTFTVENEDLK